MNSERFKFGDPGSAPKPEQSKNWQSVEISWALLELLVQQGYADHLNLEVELEDGSLVGSSEWLSSLSKLEQELYQLLSETPNQVVAKEKIFNQLWPQIVEESNLSPHLSRLVRQLEQKLPLHYHLKIMLNEGCMLLKFSAESSLLERRLIQDLTANELKLFRLFWQHLNQVVTREDCYQLLWGDGQSESDQYQYIKLSNIVGSLRKKLKEVRAGCEIETIFNQGYKLTVNKM